MAPKRVNTSGLTGRGTPVQRARLWSGVVLFVYATTHFINHGLGHISLEAMESAASWQNLLWQSYPGTVLLYGALAIHLVLGIWKIANLDSYHRPFWEWSQIVLGLAIPFWLVSHIVYTRFGEQTLGIEVDYAQELALIWSGAILQQTALLLIVWIHGCIGLHFWLRIYDGYSRWFPILTSLAVVIPTISITGWIAAARRQADAADAQIAIAAQSNTEAAQAAQDQAAMVSYVRRTLGEWESYAHNILIISVIALITVLLIRYILRRFKDHVQVTYGDGTVVSSFPGTTILDISRIAGIPHMAVCGGRARCSTCRTLIIKGGEGLSPPTPAEADLLSKLNASPGIRLACQAKVNGNVELRPLIQPQQHISSPRNADPLGWGVEREIAVFFLDIRGFSKISEKSLPYDVVFILNSFFGEIAAEVEAVNGYVDKFMGDGMMALFGLDSTPIEACRDALSAAVNTLKASENVSRILTQHIDEPIKIGIGIHIGTAVVGRIGKTIDQVGPSRLTAIGDSVNIAARLESANKELNSVVVISKAVADIAELPGNMKLGQNSKITVHNISKPIEVISICDPKNLEIAISQCGGN